MKILITGKDSYIGTSFEKWIKLHNPKWEINTIDTKDEAWKQLDFNGYDTVIHVAGIAHVSTEPKMEKLYYKVNRDLALEVACKAKVDGIKQIIFMSSMILYGSDEGVGITNVITRETEPRPFNFYGCSKLEADLGIQKLNDENFKTAIIRTPMVYGPNGKGNFPKLIKIAKITPIFPSLENKRSMIYIDNLCEFMRMLVESKSQGIFFPQNREYVGTRDIIQVAAKCMGKKVWFIGLGNPFIKFFSRYIRIINKVLGNKIYDKKISDDFEYKYCVVDFEESIRKSIG